MGREIFIPVLEDYYRYTVCCIILSLPVFTHSVSEMVKYVHLAMRNYAPLTAGLSTFIFIAKKLAVT